MPPELIVNPSTHFLESPSLSLSTFSSDKKLKLLEIAKDISIKQGIIPNINTLCELVGVDVTNFYKHLKIDSAFKDAWNQCLLNVEANIQTKMAEFAYRPGNYMDRITVLRRIAPERWNPEYKVTASVDVNLMTNLIDRAKSLDAEIVDPGKENPTPSPTITQSHD